MKGVDDYEVVDEFSGEELVGLEYVPLRDWFRDSEELAGNENVYHTFAGDYVEVTEGTGIVTINGSYGEIDMEAAKKNGLPLLMDIEMTGEFNEHGHDYAGMYVKDMEGKFIEDLKSEGRVFRVEKYKHSYPHCWRCDTPLMNYATAAWFVKVEDLKDRMIEENEKVHWTPEHVGHGRFHDWLKNARDWCISRNRYWGAPLPIWISESGKMICVGSIEELENLSGEKIEDIHKHFVDKIEFEKDGEKYTRVPEVLDCWFESGSMPYAQGHYPFDGKDTFEMNFPGDFIAEGLDQTRGWFYTLMVLGVALFDKAPYKNVIVNGLVLAEDGKKMSKKLKNYPDPNDVFEKYGADALRFYLMNSPIVRAEPLRFSEKGVNDVVRKILLPIWNSYSFFVTYANIDNFSPSDELRNADHPPKVENKLDRWILSELETLLRSLTSEMDNYDLQKATSPIVEFIESLTNWYIRRSRRRFWKSDSDTDKDEAYQTLYYCLVQLSQIIAPFTPFISEEIYTNLTGKESVHLSDWPEFDENKIDEDLNEEMALVRKVVSLGHTLRARLKLKVRQPLAKVMIALMDEVDGELVMAQKDVIMEELNVKELEIIGESAGVVEQTVSVNPRELGPKYGAKVQDIIKGIKSGDCGINDDGSVNVAGILLEPNEVEIVFKGKEGEDVEGDRGVVVAYDAELTEDLVNEGYARDLVRYIQDLRKSADYDVDQKIVVSIKGLESVVSAFGDYIMNETLTSEMVESISEADESVEVELGDEKVVISISKV